MHSFHNHRWVGRSTDDGSIVEFRLQRKRALAISRPYALELRYPDQPPGAWQTISWVSNADEASWVLENFYETIFENIERMP